MAEGQAGLENDTLRVYGFSFDFPASAKLEFNPKFTRDEGDVAVKQADGAVIFVSWGQLSKVTKSLPTASDHAVYSLGRLKSGARRGLTSLEHREMEVNGHAGVYNHVRAATAAGLLGGRREQEIRSLHLHCPASGRYFVLSCSAPSSASDAGGAMTTVASTLRCH